MHIWHSAKIVMCENESKYCETWFYFYFFTFSPQ